MQENIDPNTQPDRASSTPRFSPEMVSQYEERFDGTEAGEDGGSKRLPEEPGVDGTEAGVDGVDRGGKRLPEELGVDETKAAEAHQD